MEGASAIRPRFAHTNTTGVCGGEGGGRSVNLANCESLGDLKFKFTLTIVSSAIV